MSVVIVANPSAGNGRARRHARRLERALAAEGIRAELRFTAGPGHATQLARDAVRADADVLLAVGGDGTLNEVVNGFFPARAEGRPRTALAIAPVGTGTDFAKAVRQGAEPEEVVRRIRRGDRRAIDVGLAKFPDLHGAPTERYFLNIAEFGSGGAVVEKVNRTTKVLGGRVSFLLAILSVMPKYANTFVSWRLDDGTAGQGIVNNFIAANGRYFGGGLMPAPKAEIDDGLLDVVIVGDIDWAFAKRHLKDMRRGTHLALKEVTFHRARVIETVSRGGAFLDLDGELVGQDPTRFEVLPKAIEILM